MKWSGVVQEDMGTSVGTQEAGMGDQDTTLFQDKARSSQAPCGWAVSCTGHIRSSLSPSFLSVNGLDKIFFTKSMSG